jgi:AcrR family transcriptional regulator
MASRWSGRGPRSVRDEAPLQAGDIVVAAARLTAELGLDGWSLRQLAESLGCWPQAVTHHLGDREAVELAVVDHVVSMIVAPGRQASWRKWFRALLWEFRSILERYPGTARWLSLHGPVVPSALPIIDEGVRRLRDAGLAERDAVLCYVALVSVALLPVAYDDERAHRPRVVNRIHQVFTDHVDDPELPGVAAVARVWLAGDYSRELFEHTVERTLDGVACRIAAVRESPSVFQAQPIPDN